MKNKPARLRPKLRARSSYSRNNKHPYQYPTWVRNGEHPPKEILCTLLNNYTAAGAS